MTRTEHVAAAPVGRLLAEDVMSDHLVVVGAEATVGEAVRLMRHWGVRHLPVTRDGCFVGLVDDRLVERALSTAGDQQAVGQVMSRYVPQVERETPLARVAALLRGSRSDAVAVIDAQEQLLGLVTLLDVAAAVARSEQG